jgi:hypothetical protein
MSNAILQFVYAGVIFVIIFISGFWLTFTGKPYNGIILTVHKLISLAALVFLGYLLYRVHQGAGLSTVVIIASVFTAIFFIALIATGGMLSSDLPPSSLVLLLHFVLPYLTVVSSGVMLYFLLGR